MKITHFDANYPWKLGDTSLAQGGGVSVVTGDSGSTGGSSGPAGGDLAGSFPDPSVVGIQGTPVDPLPVSATEYLDGTGHWSTPAGTGGGGGGGSDVVNVATGAGSVTIPGLKASPDAVPASPSAYDDEFDSFSGWTTFGSPSICNVTDFASHLHLAGTPSTAGTLSGIYKTAPTPPYTIYAKLSDLFGTAAYAQVGIVLGEASPGKFFHWGYKSGTGYGAYRNGGWHKWTAYNSIGSGTDIDIGAAALLPWRWMKLVVTASNNVALYIAAFEPYLSLGTNIPAHWGTVATGVDPGFTVGTFGLAVTGEANAVTVHSVWDFIRIV